MNHTIRIVLVDDHALLRETLRDRLAAEPDMCVVGAAGTADDAIPLALAEQPDVILMDIDMPGL